jgi:hypothetical protein
LAKGPKTEEYKIKKGIVRTKKISEGKLHSDFSGCFDIMFSDLNNLISDSLSAKFSIKIGSEVLKGKGRGQKEVSELLDLDNETKENITKMADLFNVEY